jgi:hypothetical protein
VSRPARDVAGILVSFLLTGGLCGWLWEALWTPPSGVAYRHKWVLDGAGMPRDFDGTGTYFVIAVLAGLLVGLVVSVVFDASAMLTLAVVLAGAALGGYVMWQVGTLLGPPDPATVAKHAEDLAPVPGSLEVHGLGSFLAFPLGAVTGTAAAFFAVPKNGESTPPSSPRIGLDDYAGPHVRNSD